jgi:serine/threonine-protein kinase RsbW
MVATQTFCLDGQLSELAGLNEQVAAFLGDHAISPAAEYTLYLVLEEVVTNAIRHGGAGRVEVVLALDDRSLDVMVTDDGPPFDPTTRPDPDLDLPLEARAVGGLGIHLIRRMCRAMAYRRNGDRNELRVQIDRHKPT